MEGGFPCITYPLGVIRRDHASSKPDFPQLHHRSHMGTATDWRVVRVVSYSDTAPSAQNAAMCRTMQLFCFTVDRRECCNLQGCTLIDILTGIACLQVRTASTTMPCGVKVPSQLSLKRQQILPHDTSSELFRDCMISTLCFTLPLHIQ